MSRLGSFPILRLELKHMKHSILVALDNYTSQLDSDLRKHVEAFCTSEVLQRKISEMVERGITEAIGSAIKNALSYGPIHNELNTLVREKLAVALKVKL